MNRITLIQITTAIMARKIDGVNSSHQCRHWKMDQIESQHWYRPKVKHLMGPHCSIVVTISHSKQLIRITIDLVNQVNCPVSKTYPICIPSKLTHPPQMHRICRRTVCPMAMSSHYLRHHDMRMTLVHGLYWAHRTACHQLVWVDKDHYF